MIPPHPDAEEEVHLRYRRRRTRASSSRNGNDNRNIRQANNSTIRISTTNADEAAEGEYYEPELLHPTICHHYSDEECREMDSEMKANARRLQIVASSRGRINVLVLLIKFSDQRNRPCPRRQEYRKLMKGNMQRDDDDVIPTGTIKDWVKTNSFGRLEFDSTVVGWRTTNNTERFFAAGVSGITHDFRYSMYPVLDQLEEENFDFSEFDQNDDGLIDAVMVFHSGYPAEYGGYDCSTGAGNQDRIWGHAVAYQRNHWVSQKTGKRVNGYAAVSGLRGTCGTEITRLGVPTHEMMHVFGLPDLNDISGEWIGFGMGNFGIMSNPHGRNADGKHPGFLCAWSKIRLGWADPIEIEEDGVYELPSQTHNVVYKISKPYPEDEYLLIERRDPIQWDELLWDGGILIMHIDDSKRGQIQRGFPGQDGWPGNNRHYQVAVLSPDTQYDLERGKNGGDENDFFRPGDVLGPSIVEQRASDSATYPNTNSYKNGNIVSTGVWIYDIRHNSREGTTTFEVSGLSSIVAPSPAPQVPITTRPPAFAALRNNVGGSKKSVSLSSQYGGFGGRGNKRKLKGVRTTAAVTSPHQGPANAPTEPPSPLEPS